jgi:O-antigen/teichoic acid export membrane protein
MPLRRSLVFSFIDRYSALLTGIVSSMVIARLLRPDEVGVFSIAMVLLALASTLRDMGAGQYLLQERELTPDRIRAVWTVQLGSGVLLATIVGLAGPAVAAFYAEPRLMPVMYVLAVNYLVNPFGSITYAWLMREMRFDSVAVIRFTSTLAGALISIYLAWRGHGAISLAWGSLAATVVTAFVAGAYRPKEYPWLPGFAEVPRVLSFGTRMTSTSILQTVTNGFPEFFLGKAHGMAAAGLFSRANGLSAMFHRLVSDAALSVAVAMFSQKVRAKEDIRAPFIKALAYVCALGWTFAFNVGLLAYPLVRVLYGSQWDDSVQIVRLLAVALALALPFKLCHSALLGAGRSSAILRLSFGSSILTIVCAGIGGWHGLTELSVGLVVSSGLIGAMWLAAVRSLAGFRWREVIEASTRSLGVAAVSAALPAVIVAVMGTRPVGFDLLIELALGGAAAAFGLIVGARLMNHPLYDEFKTVAGKLRTRFKRRG